MALGPGSIAFVGYNGDGNDNIAFVALADIAVGTVINFTDNAWNGSSFAATESIFSWTATAAVAAGTVININNIGSGTLGASSGSVAFTSSTNTGLSNDSEVVYAYTGSASAPTFLAAISNIGFGTSDGTLTGTGLTAGQTAVGLAGGVDIAGYNGSRSGQASYAEYLASINSAANWATQNGSGNQSADGTSPDAPFPTTGFTVTAPAGQTVSFSPASVSVTEGNSGTQTLTFTVTRAGGTTGALTFSGNFAAGTTDAADFGGTLPASTFDGTIADGANSATITITISGDTLAETNEAFTLTLTSADNPSASVTIGTASATGTITNDDGTLISDNTTTAQTLANNDHLTIASGVTLSGATPVTWNAGSTAPGAVLDNFGTISGTDRAIYTTTSAVSGSLTVNNAAGAMITATKDAIKIANLTSGQTGTVTINNDGTIRSTGTGDDAGQALDLDTVASSGVHVVINNSATGLIQAADADAIRPGSNATVNNSGQILALNGNDAIDFQDVNTGGTVNNLTGGIINGGRHGITGKQAITVANAGTINGELGAGINLDTAAGVMSFVTNSGLITGHAMGASDGDGVDVDGLVTLDNSGTIEAFGTSSASLSEALAIGGGSVHNRAGGIITSEQRAITVDDSDGGSAFAAITIINEGLIKGGSGEAIAITGDFADTLTNSGQILGSVSLGGGADIVNLSAGSTVSGLIDGGEGDDTIHLLGTGAGALGATAGVESLVVQEGTWSVTGSDIYNAITIEDGGTVTSTVTLNGDDDLTIAAGGKLVSATAIIWAGGGDATVENAGLIEASSRVFNTVANAAGSLTFNNEIGGTVRGPLSPQQAAAADATVTINNAGMMESSGRVIDFQNLVSGGADVTINNLATGTIRQTGSDTDVIRPGQNTVVNNWGIITTAAGFAGGGDLIDYQGGTGGKVNNYAGGWMEASRHAVTGDNAVTVYNEGTMIGRNGSAVNIDNGGSEAEKVFVTNHGTMEGRSAELSDSDGDAIDVDGLAQILNYGRIAGLGAEGYHDGEPNVSEGIAIGGGTILNYGANAEIYGYGRAIQVDNSSNSNALGKTLINNEGLIKGDGHGPEGVLPADAARFDLRGNEAINLVGDYDDEILNQSTGRIVGGVSMGGGNDHLQSMGSFTATGGSAIDMGAGNDTVYFYTGTTVQGSVLLGTGDDLLLSTAGSGFAIDAGDGNDQIYLDSNYSGDDTLAGGLGNDSIYAGAGDDTIDGGDGNDTLSGENGVDVIDGGLGDDTIMGGAGADTLRGGDGNDTIQAGTGDIVSGGAGNDIIEVSIANGTPASIDGGADEDTLKLLGIGTGVLGATTGVENLLVQEGTWSITDGAVNFSDVTIKSGATVTSSIQVGDGDHLIIEAGAKVQVASSAVIGVSWLGGETTVDNYGLIQASSFTANAFRGQSPAGHLTFNNYEGAEVRGYFAVSGAFFVAGSSADISNAGKMSQVDVRSDAAHVTFENLATGLILGDQANRKLVRIGGNVDFTNAGQIISAADTPTSNGGDAVIYEGIRGTHVSITNLTGGRIEGSRHAVTGDTGATILNQTGGVMIGRNGSAVNIDNNGTEEQKVYVTNYGTMEGRSATYADSDGDAVDVDGLAQILNYGRIAGLGANGRHDGEANVSEGIAFGGGTILNYGANAEIYGYGRAIQVDNSSNSNAFGKTLINNEGLIKGDGHGPEGANLTVEELVKFDLRGNEAIKLVGDYDDEIINGSTGRIVGGVSMGGGNDHLQSMGSFTATGGSAIDMGAGNDTVYFYTGTTVQGSVLLGTGDDLLLATAGSGFAIDAGDGNDQIYLDSTFSGNDTLAGGLGNDSIYAGAGDDTIDGGDGNDTLNGENGVDVIDGGLGDDTIMGGAGDDTLRGGDGNDTIQAGTGDIVSGGAGDDVIEVAAETGAPASIDGGEGEDTVKLAAANAAAVGSLGAASGVEKLVVQEGAWSVAGSESYSDIAIEDGATVTSQVNVSGNDKVTVEQGGTLNVNSDSGNAVSIEGATTDVVIDNAGLIHSGPNAAHAIGGGFGSDPQSVKIVNRATGVISSEWQATIAFSSDYETSGGGNIVIENAGLIESPNTTVIQIQDLYGTTATINNLAGGIIRGNHNGDVMRLGSGAVLNNAGTIVNAETGSFFGDAVDFQNSAGGVVNNLAGGLIEGSRHGITGKSNVSITNEAGAVIYGRNGSGVNFDTDEEDQIFSVTNHGTIRGAAMQDDPDTEETDIDGDGVDIDYTVLLHNYGRIEALGAKGYKDGFENFSEGVAAGGGEIYNHAGGVIFSVDNGILIDDGEEGAGYAATLIENDGLIEGRDGYGIKLVGDFDDTIVNKGTIIGGSGLAIDMGAGDDMLDIHSGSNISGAIIGGEGDDTVRLLGSGAGVLGATADFESLVVQGGAWSIMDSDVYSAITIENGASVISQIELSNDDKLTIKAGGTVSAQSDDPAVALLGATNGLVIDNAGTIDAVSEDGSAAAIYGRFGNVQHSFTITNREGGVIQANQKAIDIEAGSGSTGTVVIDNAGLIESGNTHAVDLRKLYSTSVTIYNRETGSIIAVADDGYDALRPAFKGAATTAVTVYNDGLIRGTDDAIDFQEGSGTLHNGATGLIESTNQNAVSGDKALVVNNAAGGVIRGMNGSGINLDTRANDPATLVNNYGLISGNYINFEDQDGDGDGVDVDGFVLIHNYGRIEANGADNIDDFADGIAAGGGEIVNHAGGQIYGETRGIFIDNSDLGDAYAPTMVTNEGAITSTLGAAIQFIGSWNDTITNSGVISSAAGMAVDMGGGNDVLFNSGTMTGANGLAIDMGAGDDAVVNFTGGVIDGAIRLGEGDDQFFGNESDENADGGEGSDLLSGGGGSDTLSGGDGADVYSYVLGDGSDVVIEGAGVVGDVDLLLFDEVEAAGVTLQKHGADIEVVLADGSVITLKDQLAGGGVENIVFSDGVILDRNDVEAALVNRGPVAADDLLDAVAEDAPSFLISLADLLGNDSDADLDVLSITALTDVVGGTAVIEGDSIRFTPAANHNGPASFDYTVSDNRGGTSQATASFTVTAVNDGPMVTPPVAVVTNEDTAVTGQIVASDIEGDALTYVVKPDAGAAHGTVIIDANGNWTYTPNENYNGADSFTVLVSDGQATVEAVVSVGVTAVNDEVIANDDTLTAVAEDAPSFLISFADLLGNDTDGDLDALSITGLTGSVGGTAVIEGNAIRFTPAANFHGDASFTYTVDDGHGSTSQATASFAITSVNDAPEVVSTAPAVTLEDAPLHGQITASDIDGDTLTYAVKPQAGAAHGTVAIDANGNWTYTPDQNYNGSDSFIVLVSDGQATVEAVVTVDVTPVNDTPVAVADQGVADENEARLFDLLANDGDIDGGALSLSGFSVTGVSGIALDNAQAQAAFSVQNGQLAFNPGDLFDGLDDGDTATVTISYTVQDADGASSTANFVLTVTGAADANVIVGSSGGDSLFGTSGMDIVAAGDGNDYVFGRDGSDVIDAGKGTDVVFGGAGDDVIDGGAGKDTLFGDVGDDTLAGGAGNDLLYGGDGDDTFVFHAGEGRDIVYDFQAGAGAGDVIELDSSLFADFDALMQAGAVTDTAIGAQVSYGDGSTVTLNGIHKADLAIDDFRFA